MSDFVHDKAQEMIDAIAAGDDMRMTYACVEVMEESAGSVTARMQALAKAVEDHCNTTG
ncbi:hypothetical protein ACH4SP_25835 [Streptomyces sp. NPDC021093]|uniref:hypothetical protein n=1 Tax=Streptomyces sp. NPDC021093 TaxID=3365112 RepID=UPI0037BD79A2